MQNIFKLCIFVWVQPFIQNENKGTHKLNECTQIRNHKRLRDDIHIFRREENALRYCGTFYLRIRFTKCHQVMHCEFHQCSNTPNSLPQSPSENIATFNWHYRYYDYNIWLVHNRVPYWDHISYINSKRDFRIMWTLKWGGGLSQIKINCSPRFEISLNSRTTGYFTNLLSSCWGNYALREWMS